MALPPRAGKASLGAILVTLFLSAMDQTIVGTALPRIVAELQGFALYAWVFTAYMLTSTVTVPIAGKLGDLYGRRSVLLAGIAVFLAASVLGAVAGSMPVLVLARGLQGVGSGVITANAFALIGDLFSPAERGRYTGLFSGVYALASVAGPLLGGAITDGWSWRGVFLVNLPIGVVASVVLVLALPKEQRRGEVRPLDWLGALTLVGAVTPLMLALAQGKGGQEMVPSALRGPALVLAVVMLAAFVVVERRAPEPIVPLGLFRRSVFALAIAIAFIAGAALYAGGVFVPLFMQGVRNSSATDAGLVLTPMTAVLVIGSIASGQLVTRTGKYRWIAISGLVLATAGLYPLSRLSPETTPLQIMVCMGLVGLGLGLTLPSLSLAAQNAVEHRHLGVSSSLPQFARTLAGTLGVALLGALMERNRADGLAPALGTVFLVATGIMGSAALLSLLLRDIPLRRTREGEQR